MIVITGAAGLIGKNILKQEIDDLYATKYLDFYCHSDGPIVIIDKHPERVKVYLEPYSHFLEEKNKNRYFSNFKLNDKIVYIDYQHAENFLKINKNKISAIYHMGWHTDTMCDDNSIFSQNFKFSTFLLDLAVQNNIFFIYASSAAIYGDGKNGFSDKVEDFKKYKNKQLNLYATYKYIFDNVVLYTIEKNPKAKIYGFRFFNVYGFNESHKGRMASVMYHFYNEIKTTKKIKLFKSYNKKYKDGEQKRDFIYVEDIVNTIFGITNDLPSNIYNLGTGKARTYNDVAKIMFNVLNFKENIEYIDMPKELKEKYQYFTQADMEKTFDFFDINQNHFYSLESGIKNYINILENEH